MTALPLVPGGSIAAAAVAVAADLEAAYRQVEDIRAHLREFPVPDAVHYIGVSGSVMTDDVKEQLRTSGEEMALRVEQIHKVLDKTVEAIRNAAQILAQADDEAAALAQELLTVIENTDPSTYVSTQLSDPGQGDTSSGGAPDDTKNDF